MPPSTRPAAQMIATIRFWLCGAAASYAVALFGHAWLAAAVQHLAVRRAFDAAAALLWGGLLLGAIARWQPGWPAPYWRLSLVGAGLVLAVLGLWLVHPRLVLDDLAAPLLGLATAAMLPRLLPSGVVGRWLGRDRRR